MPREPGRLGWSGRSDTYESEAGVRDHQIALVAPPDRADRWGGAAWAATWTGSELEGVTVPNRYTIASFHAWGAPAPLPPASPTINIALAGGRPHGRRLSETVEVGLDGHCFHVGGWLDDTSSPASPTLLLDTDLRANARDARSLCRGEGGLEGRVGLMRAGVLGIAGVRMLLVNGFDKVATYEMVGAHGGLVVLELLRSLAFRRGTTTADPRVIEDVRAACVHRPTGGAGCDGVFDMRSACAMLGGSFLEPYQHAVAGGGGAFDLARLAGAFSQPAGARALAKSA